MVLLGYRGTVDKQALLRTDSVRVLFDDGDIEIYSFIEFNSMLRGKCEARFASDAHELDVEISEN